MPRVFFPITVQRQQSETLSQCWTSGKMPKRGTSFLHLFGFQRTRRGLATAASSVGHFPFCHSQPKATIKYSKGIQLKINY